MVDVDYDPAATHGLLAELLQPLDNDHDVEAQAITEIIVDSHSIMAKARMSVGAIACGPSSQPAQRPPLEALAISLT